MTACTRRVLYAKSALHESAGGGTVTHTAYTHIMRLIIIITAKVQSGTLAAPESVWLTADVIRHSSPVLHTHAFGEYLLWQIARSLNC